MESQGDRSLDNIDYVCAIALEETKTFISRYRHMITDFVWPGIALIFPRLCDLTPLYYLLWNYMQTPVFKNNFLSCFDKTIMPNLINNFNKCVDLKTKITYSAHVDMAFCYISIITNSRRFK